MPIHTNVETLQDVIRPALALREDAECYLDISPDEIRFRARSEDREVYLDHTIPTTAPELSGIDVSGSYLVWLKNIKSISTVSSTEEVTIRIPAETPDATFTFQSGGLTYRNPPLSKANGHRVFDSITAEVATEISIQNYVFNQAINLANLLGTSLQVHYNHDSKSIEFSAENTEIGDSFHYSHAVEQIHCIQPEATELTISIDRLRDLTPLVPAGSLVSLKLTPHHLTYRAEHPITGSNLTVYIAEYLKAIDG